MFFLSVFIFIVIGVVLGILFNKFFIKYFSGNKRKIVCVLTMVIFILSSISLGVTFGIKSIIVSSISSYSDKVERYIYDTYPNNQFLLNGINLNVVYDDTIITNSVSELKELIPTHTDLRVNKRVYDVIIGAPINEIINQINNLTSTAAARARNVTNIVSNIIDNNNYITVSSILNYLKSVANKHINIYFIKIIIPLLVPLVIYVLSISMVAFISARKKLNKEKTVYNT